MNFTFTDFIFSFIVTWVVILTPPTLIRAISKKPLNKIPSIWICSVFYIINLTVFIMMGSQSKSHFAILIGAFISYRILMYPPKSSGADLTSSNHENHAKSQVPIETVSDSDLKASSPHDETKPNSVHQSPTPFNASFTNPIVNKLMSLNYKKGMYRIWIVATIMWIPFSLYQDTDQIAYTFKYILNKHKIEIDQANKYKIAISDFKKAKDLVSKQKIVPSSYKEPYESYGIISDEDLWASIKSFIHEDSSSQALDKRSKFIRDIDIEHTNRKAKDLISKIDFNIKVYEDLLSNNKVESPDYRWLLRAFVLPLLVIPSLVIMYYTFILLFRILRWVISGFSIK